jgi:hypothetical protein
MGTSCAIAMGRPNRAPSTSPAGHDWLTLTDLGRLYGVSAVHCGRLLSEAGLRQHDGNPTRTALQEGLAHRTHPGSSVVWQSQGCCAVLEASGLMPMAQRTLIEQWVDLISALVVGSPSVNASAEEMAREIPDHLVQPVNAELLRRGCSFQVQPVPRKGNNHQASRRASACRAACSSNSRKRSSSV